jgi:tetratricopeptide (TPR) repeat protein
VRAAATAPRAATALRAARSATGSLPLAAGAIGSLAAVLLLGAGAAAAKASPVALPPAPAAAAKAAPAAPHPAPAAAAKAAPAAPTAGAAMPSMSPMAPSAAFEAGEKALAAGDLAAALGEMEVALAGAPDNLRYASEYRHAAIRAGAYDRALDTFEKLVASHPDSAYAWLNYGYAYVDKMPAAGAITQVILANDALKKFSRSIELKATWLALYTRGNSYLYWPKIFGKGELAVADLERAVEMSRTGPKRAYQAHAYAALGDAYWRTDQPDRARATWAEGARLFPQDEKLKARLVRQGEELEAYLTDQLDRTKRVDTDLHEMWEEK